MLHLRLLALGFALIIAGLMVAVVLDLGGAWMPIGVAMEIAGVVVLGINIGLMLKNRKPGGPPR